MWGQVRKPRLPFKKLAGSWCGLLAAVDDMAAPQADWTTVLLDAGAQHSYMILLVICLEHNEGLQ